MTETEARKRFEAAGVALELERARLCKAGMYAWLTRHPSDPPGHPRGLCEFWALGVIVRTKFEARELAAHWTSLVFEHEAGAGFRVGERLGRWHVDIEIPLAGGVVELAQVAA